MIQRNFPAPAWLDLKTFAPQPQLQCQRLDDWKAGAMTDQRGPTVDEAAGMKWWNAARRYAGFVPDCPVERA